MFLPKLRPGFRVRGLLSGLAVLLLACVAVRTLVRRVFVNHNFFLANRSRLRMAFAAVDIRMSTRQRQVRLRVMVKCGGHPTLHIMAFRAMRLIVFGQELSIVRVLMAGLALLRRAFESRFGSRSRLVALSTCHGSVCPQEWKLCLRVIEAADVPPGLGIVASLAAKRPSVRTFSRHLLVELTFMRVLMASRAGLVLEAER